MFGCSFSFYKWHTGMYTSIASSLAWCNNVVSTAIAHWFNIKWTSIELFYGLQKLETPGLQMLFAFHINCVECRHEHIYHTKRLYPVYVESEPNVSLLYMYAQRYIITPTLCLWKWNSLAGRQSMLTASIFAVLPY